MSAPTPDVGVRPARATDAAAVASVQGRLWREVYAPLLPPAAGETALAALAAGDPLATWAEAATAPPTPRHHLLVATAAGTVVGYATVGPAVDDDLDPSDAEVDQLLVSPDVRGAGHGSRLLAAVVDVLRADGAAHAVTWLFQADADSLAFLTAAGWAPDGARRDLEIGSELVGQLRLHTSLAAG